MRRLLTLLAILSVGLLGAVVPDAEAGIGTAPDSDADGVERFAFPGSGTADAVAVGAYGVWIADSVAGHVVRFDTHTEEFVETLDVASPTDLAVRQGSVWVTSDAGVTQIDEKTRTIIGFVPSDVLGITPGAVVVADESVWLVGSAENTVVRLDQDDRTVEATIPVGSSPTDIAFDQSAAWVSNVGDGTISRIGTTTNEVRTVKNKHLDPGAIAGGATTGVWTEGTKAPASVCRIGKKPSLDVCTKLDAEPVALSSGFALVWVAAEKGRVYAVNAIRPGSKRSYFTDATSLGDIATDGAVGWAVDTVAGASELLSIGA